MLDLVTVSLRAAAFLLAKGCEKDGHLAGLLNQVSAGKADQSVGAFLKTVEERLAIAQFDERDALRRTLLESYWVAALLVANDCGFHIHAPLTNTEILSAPQNTNTFLKSCTQKLAAAWATIRPPEDPLVGVMLQPQQDSIRKLYAFLLQQAGAAAKDAELADGRVVDEAYHRVEHLLVSDPQGHAEVTAVVVRQLQQAVDAHLAQIDAPDELRNKLQSLLRERWPSYFTGLFRAAMQTNEAVKSLVFARLLADLHVRRTDGTVVAIKPEDLEQGLARIAQQLDDRFDLLAATQQETLANTRELIRLLGGQLRLARHQAGPIPNLSTRIFGRENEARALCDAAARLDGPKVVALVAPPGFGKTGVLVATLQQARDEATGQWRPEVAHAVLAWDFRDPAEGRLGAILRRIVELAEQPQRDLLERWEALDLPVAEKCARVFSLLDAAAGAGPTGRIWLLWQNSENLLTEDRRFRDPELGAFARMLWEQEHRCCLIVESRLLPELPPVRIRLSPFAGARTLEHGLADDAAMEWLRTERALTESSGLRRASDADLEALLRRVHGVPLALASVISYLNGPGSETTLRALLDDSELFAGFDQEDESLRQEGFRPIVRRHFARLTEDEQRVLGFVARVPFPVRREALDVVLPDRRRLDAVLSSQCRSRMILDTESVVAGGVPVVVYGMMPPLQEVIAGVAGELELAVVFAIWNRGNAAWRRQDHRLALHLHQVVEVWMAGLVSAGRSELENHLAAARGNKGIALSDLGQHAAAIAEFQAAIDIRQRLVSAGRNELENDLAKARLNKGVALSDLGQHATAIAEYQAAIDILQRLVSAGRTELENDLAGARMNKGVALSDLGQHAAAIDEYQAAIDIRQRLVSAGRSELEFHLAMARMNKGNALRVLGQPATAIDEYQAAIDILQRLVSAGRTELETHLAGARMNKGVALRDLGQPAAAIAEYQAAIDIRQRMVSAGRTELENDLATARMNKGNALSDLGKHAAAIAEHQAAIDIRQRLVSAGRTELENDLAAARTNKGNALVDLGQPAAAIAEYQAAIDILQGLVSAGRTELENHLATARMNKGNALRVLGQPAAAIAEFQAAIVILQRLVSAGRGELENHLATARMKKGVALSSLGQHAVAIAECQAAIDILQRLVSAGRNELRPDLARALANRAIALGLLGRNEEGCADRQRALDLIGEARREGMEGLDSLESWILSTEEQLGCP